MPTKEKKAALEQAKNHIEDAVKILEATIHRDTDGDSVRRRYDIDIESYRKLLKILNSAKALSNAMEFGDCFYGQYSFKDKFVSEIVGNDTLDSVPGLYGDFDETFEYLMSTLTEEQAKVIRCYFIKGMTMENIAIDMGISVHEVRKLKNESIKLLRSFKDYIIYGKTYVDLTNEFKKEQSIHNAIKAKIIFKEMELNDLIRDNAGRTIDLQRFEDIKNQISSYSSLSSSEYRIARAKNMNIANLGIPTRSYNALNRLGIRTVGDLCCYTKDALCNAENLGPVGVTTICLKIHKYHCYLKDEQKELDVPIKVLDFTVRTENCLRRSDINTLCDLLSYTEKDIINIRNLSRKSFEEIISKLAEYNLDLAID